MTETKNRGAFHETPRFLWTECPGCARLGIHRPMVKVKARNYSLTIEDAAVIYEVSPAVFYPHHVVRFEPGCEAATWHIIIERRDAVHI